MGFMDSVKSAMGMGSGEQSEADEMAEDWIDDVDSEVQESDEMLEDDTQVETEPAEDEWESAYKFAEEFLEYRGFASMMDFTNKCMAMKINQSPMYRDRISNGVDTMNRITTMQEQMSQISGGQQQETSFAEKAEKLKHANEVIDQADKLSGKEDAMVNEIMSIGRDLADAAVQGNVTPGQGQNVDSSVNQFDEEL